MSQASPTIVWFRSDLRLADNPALSAAIERGGPIIPVFIWAPEEEAPWSPGGARRWWLHQSLHALRQSLRDLGSDLLCFHGPTGEALDQLIDETGAGAVYWNRRYEPAIIERDKTIKKSLTDRGIDATSFNSHLIYEPWQIQTQSGGPYKVFTPFWNAFNKLPAPGSDEHSAPERIAKPPLAASQHSVSLDDLVLMPRIKWYEQMAAYWQPGEAGAHERLGAFLDDGIRAYNEQRDIPGIDGTSRLSPHLCHGEIGPRQVWHEVQRFMGDGRRNLTRQQKQHCRAFLREIGWREFAYHVLYHFPHTPESPLQEKYNTFPWREDERQLKAWQRGGTGYPLIDAGMRQLWAHGWMHNRVRMVVASFLVKDLLISWQAGAAWFWDTLVDADLANNTLGWQWAGGCGADAAPYFRVFNPVLQSKKFDAGGDYIRRFVPELGDLPIKHLHAPWAAAPPPTGGDYPAPLVDHGEARERALAALAAVTD